VELQTRAIDISVQVHGWTGNQFHAVNFISHAKQAPTTLTMYLKPQYPIYSRDQLCNTFSNNAKRYRYIVIE
jgi:hypothetical protein